MFKKIISATILLASFHVNSQSIKPHFVYYYDYKYPDFTLPEGYNEYGVIYELPDDKRKIYIDNKFEREGKAIDFNEFFKEKDVLASLATLKHYTFSKENDVESNDKFMVKISFPEVRLDAKIKKATSDVDKPYSTKYSYSIEFKYSIYNSLTKDVILETTKNVSNEYLPGGKHLTVFADYEEAKKYCAENIDKSLIGNEILNLLKNASSNLLKDLVEVRYYQSDTRIYGISKNKKLPITDEVNSYVLNFKKDLKEFNSDEQAQIENERQRIFKDSRKYFGDQNFLKFKVSSDTIGRAYIATLKEMNKTFIAKNMEFAGLVDINDKKAKRVAWANYMNVASAKMMVRDFEGATAAVDKALEIDYKPINAENLKKRILELQKEKNQIIETSTDLKPAVHYSSYL